MNVEIEFEQKRGCGYRRPGADGVGIYLAGDGIFLNCDRLPFPLTACPCCGAGIKPSRGFTWINPLRLFAPDLEPKASCRRPCMMCHPAQVGEQAGLMWVGTKFYDSPHAFVREAEALGVSKKVAAVPTDFVLGRHVIFLAHRRAVLDWADARKPAKAGVFMAFRPRRIDLVIADPANVPERACFYKKKFGKRARIIKVEPAAKRQHALPETGRLT